ncbi:uncharacterized protein [Drosophila pseudoobscura]|uniref:F-box domain-containing protein n=1 Tax=Drosophila pseudoobscura pseudoobscura TaxID=46245 RepID=A0A6I8V8M1_DROPS|nr:uncharacterized protein LOC26533357 [Drosophila pseudoobscura]
MFSNLPTEIIIKVLDYLSPKDQIQLAQVNQHLQDAFVYRSERDFKQLIGFSYEEEILSGFLPLCGYIVVDLNLYIESNLILKKVEKYCTNLEKVKFWILKVTCVTVLKSILSKESLRTIALHNMTGGGLDNMLTYINKDCKVLSLEDVSNDDMQHLPQLIGLEELEVLFRNDMVDLFKICFSYKKLRVLKICLCRMLTGGPDFVFPELEELELKHSNLYNGLPTCVKLKSLNLCCNLYNDKMNIVNIIAQCAPNLERLAFTSRKEPQFTAHHLIELLRKCRTIEFIYLSADIIRNVLLRNESSFVDVLKENGFNAERRLVIGVRDLSDKQDVENQVPNSEAWNFIKCMV